MDGLNAPSKYTEWVQLQAFTLGNVYVVIILMLVSVLTVGLPILPTLIGANLHLFVSNKGQSISHIAATQWI